MPRDTGSARIPLLGELQVRWMISGATFVAIGMVLLATVLLYRRITSIGWMSKLLLVGRAQHHGVDHRFRIHPFSHSRLAFNFPPGAFPLIERIFSWAGLGHAGRLL